MKKEISFGYGARGGENTIMVFLGLIVYLKKVNTPHSVKIKKLLGLNHRNHSHFKVFDKLIKKVGEKENKKLTHTELVHYYTSLCCYKHILKTAEGIGYVGHMCLEDHRKTSEIPELVKKLVNFCNRTMLQCENDFGPIRGLTKRKEELQKLFSDWKEV